MFQPPKRRIKRAKSHRNPRPYRRSEHELLHSNRVRCAGLVARSGDGAGDGKCSGGVGRVVHATVGETRERERADGGAGVGCGDGTEGGAESVGVVGAGWGGETGGGGCGRAEVEGCVGEVAVDADGGDGSFFEDGVQVVKLFVGGWVSEGCGGR